MSYSTTDHTGKWIYQVTFLQLLLEHRHFRLVRYHWFGGSTVRYGVQRSQRTDLITHTPALSLRQGSYSMSVLLRQQPQCAGSLSYQGAPGNAVLSWTLLAACNRTTAVECPRRYGPVCTHPPGGSYAVQNGA